MRPVEIDYTYGVATTVDDVVWLLQVMAETGAQPIVVGGWGIDALLGTQSRPHRDLDVLLQDEFVDATKARLLRVGFLVTTDWLPVRVELRDPERDRHVDIHPVFDDGRGGWWQHGPGGMRFEYPVEVLTFGAIGDDSVACLTSGKQRELHSGYEPRDEDAHDLAILDQLPGARP